MPPPARAVVWSLMPPTALFSLVSLVLYFAYRFHCLLRAQNLVAKQPGASVADGTTSLALAWLFLAIELLSILPNSLPYILRILAVRQPDRKKPRLSGQDVPTVDILITCCNEDAGVVMDTVRAACVLDYPQDRYRIMVCDDGASQEIKEEIDALAAVYPNTYYTARVKGPIKDYKAGNLNHGLVFSSHMPRATSIQDSPKRPPPAFSGGYVSRSTISMHSSTDALSLLDSRPSTRADLIEKGIFAVAGYTASEYVAGLDADMIPEPHWLSTILPHLMEDPKVAMACPPQTFYDIPINDPLTQTMSHFAGITEVVNDALGHADCLGSGYVMRRTALNSIGGFPTQSLSEDVCCSATLLGAGWKTVFVQEPLQYGSVPESLFAHIKQRTRWFVGHVQTAGLFNMRLWGQRGRHLTLIQRLAGMAFDLRQLVQVSLALSYIAIPFALLSGYPLVIWTSDFELVWLIRLVVIWVLCHWVHQAVMGAIAGLGNGWYDMRMPSYDAHSERWLGPYILAAFLRSFVLPTRLGGVKAGFTSSGSIRSDLQERSATNRAPLWTRIWVMLIHQWVLIHVLFVLACLAGLGLAFARCFSKAEIASAYNVHHPATTNQQFIYFVTRVGWPPLLWLQNTVSAMSPVLYMLSPPTAQSREDLLSRDPKTGVAYPKPGARLERKDAWIGWRHAVVGLAFLYTVSLAIISCQLQRGSGR